MYLTGLTDDIFFSKQGTKATSSYKIENFLPAQQCIAAGIFYFNELKNVIFSSSFFLSYFYFFFVLCLCTKILK